MKNNELTDQACAGAPQEKKPYLWVYPNPAGVAQELMTVEAAFEFIRGWPSYGGEGESIELTLAFLTDDEVEALPNA